MIARTRFFFPALLLLAACGAPEEDGGDAEAVRVAVAVAEEATFGERFSLTGTLTAERHAQLSPRVDGLVARVHVDAGDRVEAGQVLVELDPAVGRQALARVRAQMAEAEAAVRESERLFAEARRLGEDQYIAASQIEARESELRLAQAALESAHASAREQAELVERHALPAPFDGVVAEKLTEAGEWVQRGTPVLSLVATDRVRLDLRVPQERFAQLDDDAQVRAYADALGDTPLPARIGARVPVTDPGARTFLLRLLIHDPEARLVPGTSARAEIDLPAQEQALAVSRDALLRQPDGGYSLFVLEEAVVQEAAVENDEARPVARRRSVRVLHERDDLVAVAGDLQPGQRVVVRGNEALTDGQPVDVAEP
ncbi:efflux RND transporter periplasmic adaptor subunit [Luteimonas sp. SJ-92]|uniref:Efflux RND transporter periplasmic adaptor subunit n=1 Tax=Luteimonas salinisoli TaxID=2752307 RepID=A0A853JD27_9GAMM|nr:efflux RND transporter periplasmic adaptor subunit [Luteimonas salinisoli]NZA27196.1 efflux RND transporter periplasmic adaptor subunit [Luteimonas salinisoli]